MSKKLWTGKTAREELIGFVSNKAFVSGWPVVNAFNNAFDGAEYSPAGSITAEIWSYWNNLSAIGQSRLFNQIKKKVLADDRLMGRRLER